LDVLLNSFNSQLILSMLSPAGDHFCVFLTRLFVFLDQIHLYIFSNIIGFAQSQETRIGRCCRANNQLISHIVKQVHQTKQPRLREHQTASRAPRHGGIRGMRPSSSIENLSKDETMVLPSVSVQTVAVAAAFILLLIINQSSRGVEVQPGGSR
jgi:hypothetical protein